MKSAEQAAAEAAAAAAVQAMFDGLASVGSWTARRVKEVKSRHAVETGNAFQQYYESTRRRMARAKTILYRLEPVALYDFYVHLDVTWPDRTRVPATHVDSLLDRSDSLVITGLAGSGKTTMMRHLFLDALQADRLR